MADPACQRRLEPPTRAAAPLRFPPSDLNRTADNLHAFSLSLSLRVSAAPLRIHRPIEIGRLRFADPPRRSRSSLSLCPVDPACQPLRPPRSSPSPLLRGRANLSLAVPTCPSSPPPPLVSIECFVPRRAHLTGHLRATPSRASLRARSSAAEPRHAATVLLALDLPAPI